MHLLLDRIATKYCHETTRTVLITFYKTIKQLHICILPPLNSKPPAQNNEQTRSDDQLLAGINS